MFGQRLLIKLKPIIDVFINSKDAKANDVMSYILLSSRSGTIPIFQFWFGYFKDPSNQEKESSADKTKKEKTRLDKRLEARKRNKWKR